MTQLFLPGRELWRSDFVGPNGSVDPDRWINAGADGTGSVAVVSNAMVLSTQAGAGNSTWVDAAPMFNSVNLGVLARVSYGTLSGMGMKLGIHGGSTRDADGFLSVSYTLDTFNNLEIFARASIFGTVQVGSTISGNLTQDHEYWMWFERVAGYVSGGMWSVNERPPFGRDTSNTRALGPIVGEPSLQFRGDIITFSANSQNAGVRNVKMHEIIVYEPYQTNGIPQALIAMQDDVGGVIVNFDTVIEAAADLVIADVPGV